MALRRKCPLIRASRAGIVAFMARRSNKHATRKATPESAAKAVQQSPAEPHAHNHLLASIVPLFQRDATKYARFLKGLNPLQWGKVFAAIHQEPTLGNAFASEISQALKRLAAEDAASSKPRKASATSTQPEAGVDAGTPESANDGGPDANMELTPDAEVDAGQPEEVDASVDPAEPEQDMSGSSRHLTVGEIGYAEEIFWGTLDYRAIKITRNWKPSIGAARTLGNTIHMNTDDGDFEQDDFGRWTLELTQSGLNTLVHEMTHVWQYQNGGLNYATDALLAQGAAFVKTGSRDGAYDWRESAKSRRSWDSLNPEQQAQCVQEYDEALRKTRQRVALKDLPDPESLATMRLAQPYVNRLRAGKGAPEPGRGTAATLGAAGGMVLGGPLGALVGGVVGYIVGDD